ncbi:unnamed protein product [Orchesella dallaii]|uniref:BTB domain-containing protein n=1 Tax=Orchesella dallaii TaxID=48710 RepID=A0ABP1R5B1_9HEXA
MAVRPARMRNLPDFILKYKHDYSFTIRNLDRVQRNPHTFASDAFSHGFGHNVLHWEMALRLCPQGYVQVAYRLLEENMFPPRPEFVFIFAATVYLNGRDGTRLCYYKQFSGEHLPEIGIYRLWYSIWHLCRGPVGPREPAGRRSIQEFLDPDTGSLKMYFRAEVWQTTIDFFASTPSLSEFDAQNLRNLPEKLQHENPDVCLVTPEGFIKAHSSIFDKYPGLLDDEQDAPKSNGYCWGFVNLPFQTVVKLVLGMYGFYDGVSETQLIDLLIIANRRKMDELYSKMLGCQLNHLIEIQE